MKPNIFNIATRELSQDAFITWLLQYAGKTCKESGARLNDCGKEFVGELIRSLQNPPYRYAVKPEN